jgi:membrane protein
MEHQTARDTTTGVEMAIGERGAVVADTIGPSEARRPGAQFTQAAAEELSRAIDVAAGAPRAPSAGSRARDES